jgi:hypothetical protein
MLYRDDHYEYTDGRLSIKKVSMDSSSSRRKSSEETHEVSTGKGIRDASRDFSANNFLKTTVLWIDAIKRKEDDIFPAVYNLAKAASRWEVKQEYDSTGLENTPNVRAEIESDESTDDEVADAAADANADTNESMEEVDDIGDSGHTSKHPKRARIVRRE